MADDNQQQNLTERQFSNYLDEKFFKGYNGSIDIDPAKIHRELYYVMESQLALMFSANWGFKGLDEFGDLAQKMVLQSLAKHGRVGVFKDTTPLKKADGTDKPSTRYVPYYVMPIAYDDLTGTIISAWGLPLVMANGRNIFDFDTVASKEDVSEEEIRAKFSRAVKLDRTNCAFLSFGFSFMEYFGLIPRIGTMINKWAFSQGVLVNNIMTSQNIYIADSASAQKVASLNQQFTRLGQPIKTADSQITKSDDGKGMDVGTGTTLTPIPFQNTSIAELSAVVDFFKKETFEFMGIRQNKDSKRERQITGEIVSQELPQTMIEELVEPFLQKFAQELSDISNSTVELVDLLAYKQAETEGFIPNENAPDIPTAQEIELAKQGANTQKKGGDQ